MKIFQSHYFFSMMLGISIALCPATLCAQSLILTDCQGFTRAFQQVEPGSLSDVSIEVGNSTGTANGSQVSLTNAATNEVVAVSSVENGVASFPGLTPGSYTITTAAELSLNAVTIAPGVLSTTAAGALVAGGVVTAGGAATGVVVVADETINSSDNGDDSNGTENGSGNGGSDGSSGNGSDSQSPTPIPPSETPTPSPTPDAEADTGQDGNQTEEPVDDCTECDPDQIAPSLPEDDFFLSRSELSPYS